MRVAIIGSHGTGKSTLAQLVAEQTGLPLIVEQARVAQSKGFELDKAAHALAQTMIFLLQLEQELDNYKGFISDRSFIDSWVYIEKIKHGFSQQDLAVSNQLQKLIIKYDLKHYEKIIYVPIEFSLTGDGIRNEETDYQKELDELFVDFILRHSLPAIRVTGTPEQRLQQALGYIRL